MYWNHNFVSSFHFPSILQFVFKPISSIVLVYSSAQGWIVHRSSFSLSSVFQFSCSVDFSWERCFDSWYRQNMESHWGSLLKIHKLGLLWILEKCTDISVCGNLCRHTNGFQEPLNCYTTKLKLAVWASAILKISRNASYLRWIIPSSTRSSHIKWPLCWSGACNGLRCRPEMVRLWSGCPTLRKRAATHHLPSLHNFIML